MSAMPATPMDTCVDMTLAAHSPVLAARRDQAPVENVKAKRMRRDAMPPGNEARPG